MPEVSLLFRIRQEGTLDTRVVEQSLQRVQRTAADAARAVSGSAASQSASWGSAGQQVEDYVRRTSGGMQRAAAGTDRAEISTRQMRQAIGSLSMAFGQVNPGITLAALELANFTSEMRGASVSSKILGGSAIVAGAGVAMLVNSFLQMEAAEGRFAGIARAAQALDLGALQQSAAQSSVEIETLDRKLQSKFGRWMEGFSNIGPAVAKVFGVDIPTSVDIATEALERTRKAMAEVIPHQMGVEAAEYRGSVAGAWRSSAQQRLQQGMATGTVDRGDITRLTREMEDATRNATAAAMDQASSQRFKEMAQAGSRGTLGEESAAIEQRYKLRKDLILRNEALEIQATAALRLQGQRQLAAQELADQTAIAREGAARRVAALEQGAQLEAAVRQAQGQMAMADVAEGERAIGERQRIEYNALQESVAAAQQTGAQKAAIAAQTHARLVALLQGQLAQGLISERDYTNQVRALDQELHQAKMQNLAAQGSALSATLAKATADYTQYAAQVRQIEQSIRAAQGQTKDLQAQIRQVGMTPAEAAADQERMRQERLAEAMKRTGQEKIDALKGLQQEYAQLAIAAAQAEAAQKAADAGDPYAAQRRAQDWWSQPAKAAAADPAALAKKVADIGNLIKEAYEAAKRDAQDAADRAKMLADETERALKGLQNSIKPANDLADALARAAANSANIKIPSAGGGDGGGGGGDRFDVLKPALQAAADSFVDDIRSGAPPAEPDSFALGGTVRRTGMALVHKGETFTPEGAQNRGGGVNNTFNISNPGEDPAVFARRVARAMAAELRRQKELGY